MALWDGLKPNVRRELVKAIDEILYDNALKLYFEMYTRKNYITKADIDSAIKDFFGFKIPPYVYGTIYSPETARRKFYEHIPRFKKFIGTVKVPWSKSPIPRYVAVYLAKIASTMTNDSIYYAMLATNKKHERELTTEDVLEGVRMFVKNGPVRELKIKW